MNNIMGWTLGAGLAGLGLAGVIFTVLRSAPEAVETGLASTAAERPEPPTRPAATSPSSGSKSELLQSATGSSLQTPASHDSSLAAGTSASTPGDGAVAAQAKTEAEVQTEEAYWRLTVQENTTASGSSPQVVSIEEALASGEHPERLSMLHAPQQRFDHVAFAADPDGYFKKYASTVEPARVYDVAQPAEHLPRLQILAGNLAELAPGGQVDLQVQTAPEGIATFTSLDLGKFEDSQLPVVTRRANAEGIVTATFIATAGTVDRTTILCGSPQASGTVSFVLYVLPDQDAVKMP